MTGTRATRSMLSEPKMTIMMEKDSTFQVG